MAVLMAFTVYHHDHGHEACSTVIAETKWDASLAVDGKVVHVSDGDDLVPGAVLRSSSWNMNFREPQYRDISEEWRRYLIKRNLNSGTEDPR